eukprot:gene5043-2384_t
MLTVKTREVYLLTKQQNKVEKKKELPVPGCPNPFLLRGCKSNSDARHVVELNMSKMGVKKLHENFPKFTNLEILWLSDNKLSKLEGMFPKGYHSAAENALAVQ